ncbi:MAG: DUF6531 domain-containing protein [Oscillospiraceae bacterium]|nr:DUF6531 domain-containing protein [Oscillospiraceae bacterium]
MDFVWNRALAESVRQDCIEAIRIQTRNMRSTATRYELLAQSLDEQAVSEEFTADNATILVVVDVSPNGVITRERVEDWSTRNAARNRARELRRQATDLRTAVENLDTAMEALEGARVRTNEMFFRMRDEASSYDRTSSAQLQDTTQAIEAFTRKMETIRDGFNNSGLSPMQYLINSLSGLDGVDSNAILDALFSAAMAGFPIFSAFAGDPVNMATGNFVYSKEDMSIPGRFPLVFSRFYNELGSSENSAMGSGWTHNLNIRLRTENKKVYVIFGDGHVEAYHEMGNGQYISTLVTGNALCRTDSGWILRNPEMETYHFNDEGLLESITYINGSSTDFSYANGVLDYVSTPSGQFSFTYNDKSLLTIVTDHTGRTLEFDYKDGKLVEVIYPTGVAYRYTYDNSGRLSELFTPLGARETKSEFDSKNRATKQYLADGGVIEYIYDDENRTTTYVQQNGSKIIYKNDEKCRTTEIEYPDGSELFEFNEQNQKTSIVDKLGHKTQYAYNGAGKVTEITDALGIKTEINYSSLNQISSVIVDGQQKYQNHYDDEGELTSIEDALQYKTEFSYAEKGVPNTITQPDGSQIEFEYDERKNITKITDGCGVTTTYCYDDLNCVVATADGNGNKTQYQYNVGGNIVEVKNAVGDTRKYAYNMTGKITEITDFNGSTVYREYNVLDKPSKLIDQLGRETLLNYDSMWNLAHIVESNGAETKLNYNTLNRLETVEKPDGGVVSYEYDVNGNRTSITDELGNRVHFKYDALGRMTEVAGEDELLYSYVYNPEGQVTQASDALGNSVHLMYDAAGQLIKETNAVGDSREYTYTSLGKVECVTDEAGRVTRYEYELGGRLHAIHYPDNSKEAYFYDKGGNIKCVTDRVGRTLTYSYDSLDRVVKIVGGANATKSFTYDAVSNVTSMTDENGNITTYEYTLTGKLARVIDALGNEAAYTYDERDKLIEIRQGAGEQLRLDEDLLNANAQNLSNNKLRITRYERNIMGKVESITDALGHKESYSYDKRGQLIEKLDKDGYLTKYDYTAHGDVSHIQYADGREVKLSYNPLRQLTELEDWLGITKIEVDELGRATKVTNHQGKSVSYTWSATGLKTGMIYPDGKHVKYDYDDLLRMTAVNDGINQTLYHYDEHSRLTEKLFSNGTKTAYQYNDLGQLQELRHASVDGVLDRYQYSYDIMGNKTEIRKERKGLTDECGTYSYTYDPLNRLCEVLKDGQLQRSYEYDNFGNRSAMADGDNRTSYVYNAMNQLISIADTVGNEQSYSYDKRGNLTEVHKNGTLENQYTFGALNRLEEALNHGTGMGATYKYNGFGHRVGQSISDTDLNPTKHIDDVLDLTRNFNNLLERNDGDAATSYIWDTSLLGAMAADGTYQGYLLDEQGGPARLVHDGGNIDAYSYDEFGNTLHGTTSMSQPFGFTGYQHDPIAGTWFAQSREYDAQTGRFTAKDLNRYMNQGKVQSLNLYNYCYGNPVRYVDPLGFDLEDHLNTLFPDSDFSQNAGSNDAVQISIDGNVVTIDVFVDFRGDVDVMIPNSSGGYYSVVDLTVQGIEAIGGVYVGVFGQIVAVDVNVHQGSRSWWSWLPWVCSQNFVPTYLNVGQGRAHVADSGYSDWSRTNPGTVQMFTRTPPTSSTNRARTYWEYLQTQTHEFLHVLGVGDGNEDEGRGRPEAYMLRALEEITGYTDVMLSNWAENSVISHYTIQLMILAMLTGEWQHFMEYDDGRAQSILFTAELSKN